MTLRQQRADLCDLARAAGRDKHPREPRVEGQAAHLLSDVGQTDGVIADCRLRIADAVHDSETFQQRKRCHDRVLVRPLEPLERARIVTPRDHVEDRA